MTGGGSARAARRVAPAEWLALVVGLALVARYAWHLDDAFVYFRYVDNWTLLGRGLVFNEGERVEGFTSPLWTMLLALLRAVTPLDFWTITRGVGLVAYVAFWAQLVALRRATAPAGAPVASLPLALTAALYPVATYFTSGTESPLVLVTAAGMARFALAGGRGPALLIGLAPLVRPELLLASAALIAWSWSTRRRRPSLALGALLVANGAWLLFRVWYYADLLPNTFHAKDGTHLAWGLAYLHDALAPYGGYLLLPLAPLLVAAARRRGAELPWSPRLALVGAALLVTLHVVRIGGDARHFRYLLAPAVLLAAATSGAAEALLAGRARITGLAAAAAALLVTGALFPRQLDRHPLLHGVQENRVGVVRDAQYHRAQPELTGALLGSGDDFVRLSPDVVAALWGGGVPRLDGASSMRAEYRRAAAARAPGAVRTHWWCHDCWRFFTVRWVHDHALTDAFLARMDLAPWRPGHLGAEAHARAIELARIRERYGFDRAGALRRAVEANDAPEWMVRNLDALEVIDRKVHNRGHLLENLQLALTPVPPIPAPTREAAPAHGRADQR